MRRQALTLAVLLSALPSALARAEAPVRFAYEVRAAGFDVADINAALSLDEAGYRASLSYRTTGLYGALFSADITSAAQGVWNRAAAEPEQYYSYGRLRGGPRRVLLDYRRGNPVVEQLDPPEEADRDPVPPAAAAGTIDTLSAAVLLIHRIETTGNCDAAAKTFDGRRLTEISAHTVGVETLSALSGSPYRGPALRCDFVGQQLAGFLRDDNDFARRPHHGSAWFAHVLPGAPPLPVRISFETRWFGYATAVLMRAQLAKGS
jgi:hypothetical protein